MTLPVTRLNWLLLLAIISLFCALSLGSVAVPMSQLIECVFGQCQSSVNDTILWQIRMPRVLVGFTVGAGLAIAGTLLQNATRNPLADPYLFGITAGAALGATIATVLLPQELGVTLPFAAFFGALCSVFIVLFVGQRFQRIEHMLLVGVAVAFLLGAASQFILYLGNPFATNQVMFWLMGSLARAESSQLYLLVPALIMALVFVLLCARQLDCLLLGDETAATLGVNIKVIRLFTLIVCAAVTAVIVAFCGGIGFVGLMIPHIARRFFGVTTAALCLGAALLGGLFLVWVDVLARTLLPAQEIPIGVLTSLFGSLFFLFLLKGRHQ